MTSVFEELAKTRPPDPELAKQFGSEVEGTVWVSMLIRYKLDGTAEVLRSFAKPAAESKVKNITKKIFSSPKVKINVNKEKEELF